MYGGNLSLDLTAFIMTQLSSLVLSGAWYRNILVNSIHVVFSITQEVGMLSGKENESFCRAYNDD